MNLVDRIVQQAAAAKYTRDSDKRREVVRIIASEPDFSLQIEWHVHSWVPLVDRVLPSGSISIAKAGARN